MVIKLLQDMQARLERAEKLVFSLATENERWKISFENLNENLNNIIGNLFLSSAFISYLGPFT